MKILIVHYVMYLLMGLTSPIMGLCPQKSGWMTNENTCLKLFQGKKKDWTSASEDCRSKEGNLVTIEDEAEQERLRSLLKISTGSGINDRYWIGASIPAFVYSSYFDQCTDGYSWRSKSCFQILPSLLNWSRAENQCRAFGGRLALIPDEETNRFLAKAMLEMAKKHNSNGSQVTYWIDGRSDGQSLTFRDYRKRAINYTNFLSSTVLEGKSCLEVFPLPLNNAEFSDWRNTSVNASENMNTSDFFSREGTEDDDKDESFSFTTSASTSVSTNLFTSFETNSDYVPEYNILQCGSKRLAACEFLLNEENETIMLGNDAIPDSTSRVANAGPQASSYVTSCREIALLSMLSDDIHTREISSDIKGSNRIPEFVATFRNHSDGYYIIKSKDSDGETKYELRHCELTKWKNELAIEKDSNKWVELYKWMSESNSIFSDFNLFGADHKNHTCVYTSSAERKPWDTSDCSSKNPYVCEYSQDKIAKHFCTSEEDKQEEWCQVDRETEILKEISKKILDNIVVSADLLLDMDSVTISSTITDLQRIVAQANNLIKNNSNGSYRPNETNVIQLTENVVTSMSYLIQPKAVDKWVALEKENVKSVVDVVNSISEYAADALMLLSNRESTTDNIKKVDVNTSSIEIRIVSVGRDSEDISSVHTFISEDGESIDTLLTDEIRKNAKSNGIAYINARYKNIRDITSAKKSTTLSVANIAWDAENNIQHDSTETNSQTAENKNVLRLATNLLSSTIRINGTNIPTAVHFAMQKENFTDSWEIVPDSGMCVFLSQIQQQEKNSDIIWSTNGCWMTDNYSMNDKYFTCECNHTTDFAILLLVFKPIHDILEGHRTSLLILTLVGHFLTMLCLLVTIAIFLCLRRQLKSDRRVIHINLYVALFLAHLTLTISILSANTASVTELLDDEPTKNNNLSCVILTFLAHITILSAIFWMLVEGIVIYRKIVVVLSHERNFLDSKYYAIGWGIPTLIATSAIAIGLSTDVGYNSKGCWLAVNNGIIWAFAGPALFVMVVNTYIIIRVLQVALRTQKRKIKRLAENSNSKKGKQKKIAYMKTTLRGIIVLSPLLGITWMCGFFVIHISVAYGFVILNAFQGVCIFMCYVVWNPEVRNALKIKVKHLKQNTFQGVYKDKSSKISKPTTIKQSYVTQILAKLTLPSSMNLRYTNSKRTEEPKAFEENKDESAEEKKSSQNPCPNTSRSSSLTSRRQSATTHSTYMSCECHSQTSLSHSISSRKNSESIHFSLKKMTSRVRPCSSTISERGNAWLHGESDRPMSAGPVMERTVPTQEKNTQNKHKQKKSFTSKTDLKKSMKSELKLAAGDAITEQRKAGNLQLSKANLDQNPDKVEHVHEKMDGWQDNVQIILENVTETTILPDGSIDVGICQMSPNAPYNRRKDRVADLQTNYTSNSQTSGLEKNSSLRPYFNGFTEQLTEDKPQKSTAKNCNLKTTANSRRSTSQRTITCNSKFCTECQFKTMKTKSKPVNTYSCPKQKANASQTLKNKHSHITDKTNNRPSSTESKDSGIQPDEQQPVADYDNSIL